MTPPAPESALETRLAVLRANGQEREWMEALFQGYYAPLATAVARVVRDRDVAQDLVQDVLTRVWHNRATIELTTTWRAYLHRAALNAALRHQERAVRSVSLDDALPVGTPEPAAPINDTLADLHHREASAAVASALTHLPTECRRVFELSRFEEMSYKEIAETLEISPKTVENQMGKALRILRQQLSGVLKNLYALVLL
jgi:RNA polymerase sigma-70 factor, ECF subfamily